MKQPLTPEQRTARLDRITEAVVLIEDRLVGLRAIQSTDTKELELTDAAFASLYYLRNLAKKAP